MSQQSHQQQPSGQLQEDQQVPMRSQQAGLKKPCTMNIKVKVALLGTVALLVAAILSSCGPVTTNSPSTPTLSPTSTLAASPTATSSPSLTAYPPPGWHMVLDDSLKTDNGTWSLDIRPDGSKCSFVGGVYHNTQITLGYPHYCLALNTDYTDFAFEVQMTIIKGDQGGMIFRSNKSVTSFYYFHISQTGSYALDIYNDNGLSQTLVSGLSTAIYSGLNQPNLLAVIAQGNTFQLYVNKQIIDTITDKESTFGHGYLGLTAHAVHIPTEVIFSNAKVWIRGTS